MTAVREDARFECWWLIARDGTPVAGNDGGVVTLLTELWLTQPLGRALAALRVSPLVDAAYRLVARNRRRVGRFVPNGSAPHRYP